MADTPSDPTFPAAGSPPIRITKPLLPDLQDLVHGLQDVWDAEWLTNNGSQAQRLEVLVREYLDVPHLSLFNNGTIALLIGLQSLGLEGEVITTPFTFPATTHVLNWNRLSPVFCDIEPESLTIDAGQIEAHITERTSAILGVHVFGNPCRLTEIDRIADRHGLAVVYDAAHAFGTTVDGRGIGTFGDLSMFSFHATKLFHTAEGGALTFRDPSLKPRVDLLRNFGIKSESEVILPGINGKMNEIQAVLGQLVLTMVDSERQARGAVRDRYRRNLADVPGLRMLEPSEPVSNSEQYLVIQVDEEEFGVPCGQVYSALRSRGVLARRYFAPLISDVPCYSQLPSAAPELLPVAHNAASSVLTLPFYGTLPPATVDAICTIVRDSRAGVPHR